jgi:hypothetical protein
LSVASGNFVSVTDQLLDYREPAPGEEPECEALVDDTWQPGFVRGWYRYADGWRASVQYFTELGSNSLAVFSAEPRQVEVPQ